VSSLNSAQCHGVNNSQAYVSSTELSSVPWGQ